MIAYPPGMEPKIVRAKIKGRIYIVNLASDKRDAYLDIPRKIKYMGCGRYHSIDNIPCRHTKERTHFWKYVD